MGIEWGSGGRRFESSRPDQLTPFNFIILPEQEKAPRTLE